MTSHITTRSAFILFSFTLSFLFWSLDTDFYFGNYLREIVLEDGCSTSCTHCSIGNQCICWGFLCHCQANGIFIVARQNSHSSGMDCKFVGRLEPFGNITAPIDHRCHFDCYIHFGAQFPSKWNHQIIVAETRPCICITQHLQSGYRSHNFGKILEFHSIKKINSISNALLHFQLLITKWERVPITLWNLDTESSQTLCWLHYTVHTLAWIIIYGGSIVMDLPELIGVKQVCFLNEFDLNFYKRKYKILNTHASI